MIKYAAKFIRLEALLRYRSFAHHIFRNVSFPVSRHRRLLRRSIFPAATDAKTDRIFLLGSTAFWILTESDVFHRPQDCGKPKDPLEKEMNVVLSKTKKLIEIGNLEEAEIVLEKALEKSKKYRSVWTNILLLLLGKITLKQAQYDKSERLYLELVKNLSEFLESSPAVERLRLWASVDLAQLYTETKHFEKAEKHFKYSLFTLEAMSVGASDFHWAVETLHSVLDGYAELLTVAGRYDDALSQRQKAHNLCVTLFGDKHLKVVRSLNELGRIYTYKGLDDDAINCFTAAIEMCRHLNGVDPMEMAALLVNSGRVHLRRGLIKQAKEHCEKAFIISDKAGNQLGLAHAKDCLQGVRDALK